MTSPAPPSAEPAGRGGTGTARAPSRRAGRPARRGRSRARSAATSRERGSSFPPAPTSRRWRAGGSSRREWRATGRTRFLFRPGATSPRAGCRSPRTRSTRRGSRTSCGSRPRQGGDARVMCFGRCAPSRVARPTTARGAPSRRRCGPAPSPRCPRKRGSAGTRCGWFDSGSGPGGSPRGRPRSRGRATASRLRGRAPPSARRSPGSCARRPLRASGRPPRRTDRPLRPGRRRASRPGRGSRNVRG